jgi:hypothetical protein
VRHSCFTHLDVITPLTFALGGRFRADQDSRNSFISNTQGLRRARFSEACAERDAISDQVKPLRSARCYHRKAQVHASKADPVTAQIKELEKTLFDLHNEIAFHHRRRPHGHDYAARQRRQYRRIPHFEEDFRELCHGHRFIQTHNTTGNIRDPAAGRRSGKSVPCHHFRVDHSLGRVAG